MKFFVLGLMLLIGTGCSPSKPKLQLFIWSDYISSNVIESFEKKFNCVVVIDTYDTNEAMYAKLKTGSPGYDLVFPSLYFVSLMKHEDLIEKIDPNRIKNFKNIDYETLDKLQYTPSAYAVPYLLTYTGLAWNTDRVFLDKVSWRIFADTKFSGRMTMLNDIRETLGAALMTLGFSVNTTEVEEINQAQELIIQWRPNLAKFESEQYKIGLATHEYFVAQAYSSDIAQLAEEAPQIAFNIPDDGGIVAFDMVALLKNAKNVDLAYELINFLLDPQIAAMNVMQTKGHTPVKGVQNYLDTSYQNNKIIFPSHEALLRCQSIKDLGKDIKLYNAAWDAIKASD